MYHLFLIPIVLFLFSTSIFGQSAILARGNPPLTQEMVRRVETVYEKILQVRLSPQQRSRLQQGTIDYWQRGDRAGIANTLSSLKFYDQAADLESMSNADTQRVLIESYRRDIQATNDPVSIVLVEAFDSAHPQMRAETRARSARDLIGSWRRPAIDRQRI